MWHASVNKPFHTLTKKMSLKVCKAATRLATKILGTQKLVSNGSNLTIEEAIGSNGPRLHIPTYSGSAYPYGNL